MMNKIFSTFFPSFSQNSDLGAMKKVSSSISSNENTESNITYSIFDLPKENIEKIEREEIKKINQNERNKPQY